MIGPASRAKKGDYVVVVGGHFRGEPEYSLQQVHSTTKGGEVKRVLQLYDRGRTKPPTEGVGRHRQQYERMSPRGITEVLVIPELTTSMVDWILENKIATQWTSLSAARTVLRTALNPAHRAKSSLNATSSSLKNLKLPPKAKFKGGRSKPLTQESLNKGRG